MLKTRLLLIIASAVVIALIFLLPKVVVNHEDEMGTNTPDSVAEKASQAHTTAPQGVLSSIQRLRGQYSEGSINEKNAIFADSLASLYEKAGKFDSAAWFAERAATVFNTTESAVRAGDYYYQAYTFALDQGKQGQLASKAQEIYGEVLKRDPDNLEVKTKMAMTYLSTSNPMQGIMMLREVLAKDPKNELAIFNLGMLSIQSGQYDKAVERLEELVKINPAHTQGQLLLGIALMNSGEKKKAREQFEKLKQMEKDPAVIATVDSYLKDLK